MSEGPKPSPTEKRFLQLLWRHFQATGSWPVVTELQREVDRNGEELEIWEISSQISNRLAVRSWGTEHEPSAVIRGIHETGDQAPELDLFVRAAMRCVELYMSDDPKPTLTRMDLPQDDFMARKVARLLAGESQFIQHLPDQITSDWRVELNWHGVRLFKRMKDLDSYLELEDEVAPRRQAAADSIKGAGLTDFMTPRSSVSDLLRALLPENVGNEVLPAAQAARARFDQATTDEARRSAVRDLAALLESLRQQLNEALPSGKDNRALFDIANNYFIRHWNEQQLTDYDALWLTWVFNLFESTFYTWLGFVVRNSGTSELSAASS